MVNARLEREIQKARRQTGLETDRAIIANDGVSHYGSKKGFLRVQVRQGTSYLAAIELPNKSPYNPGPGTSVLLGYVRGVYAIVDVDDDSIRAVGGNPDVVKLPDSNANYTNQATIPVLKAEAKSPPGTSLVVREIWRETPNGIEYDPEQAISLSSEISALSSGQHQLVGLFLLADGTVETTTSTAKSSLDPMGTADIAECYAARTPGSWLIGFWTIADGITEINSDRELLDARQFINGPQLVYSETDVSNPPTDAELDSAFGTPATVGAGFEAIVNDGGGNANVYRVVSTGSSWFYSTLTQAT